MLLDDATRLAVKAAAVARRGDARNMSAIAGTCQTSRTQPSHPPSQRSRAEACRRWARMPLASAAGRGCEQTQVAGPGDGLGPVVWVPSLAYRLRMWVFDSVGRDVQLHRRFPARSGWSAGSAARAARSRSAVQSAAGALRRAARACYRRAGRGSRRSGRRGPGARCRAWRSSRPAAGYSRNGSTAPLGSARSKRALARASRHLDTPVGHHPDPHRPADPRRRLPRRSHPPRRRRISQQRRTTLRCRRRPPAPDRGTAARPSDRHRVCRSCTGIRRARTTSQQRSTLPASRQGHGLSAQDSRSRRTKCSPAGGYQARVCRMADPLALIT